MSEKRDLPKGWVLTKLGGILTFEYGKGLRKDKRDSTGNFPVYGSNGIVGIHSKFLIEKPCLIVGRKGSAGDVHISKAPCWPIDTTYYVNAPIGLELDFLYFLFSTLSLDSLDKSTAIPGLNRNDAYAIIVPVAPLNEQIRIVAKIEELFTKLDAGIKNLKKIKAQLKRYRQSVLKAAMEGKLTEKWRKAHKGEIEPASVLLERIKEEKQKNVKGKYKEPKPIDMSGFSRLPKGWVWIRLGDILSVKSGDGLTSSKMIKDGEYPVYGGNGISGYHNKYMFEKGRVIIGRVGAKCGVVHITQPKSWVTDNALIVDFSNLEIKFLLYALGYLNLNKYSVSTAQPVISGSKIYPIPFNLPPLAEQQKIVEEIEHHLSIADEIEKVVEQGLKQSERLRQSILKKAFSGKLVPQDPTDEPANVLLERIKEEKANAEQKTKERKKYSKQMELI